MDDFGISEPQPRLIQFLQDQLACESPSYPSFQSVSDNLKAHPEDIQSTLSFIFSTLNSPAKDWRRINNALALTFTLLNSGNMSVFQNLRQKSELFKQLMEFFYIENRVDKGGVVRDKARMVFFCLTTPGILEAERVTHQKPKNSPWHVEESRVKVESPVKPKEDLFRQGEPNKNLLRQEEPKKVNMFQGINVKTPGNFQSSKKVAEQDLLGDFEVGKPETVKKVELGSDLLSIHDQPVKKVDLGFDLLSIHEEPVKIAPISKTENWMDIPIMSSNKPAESFKTEPKVMCNIGEQGPSLLTMKTMPSVSKPSQPQPSPLPKDLESKLLSFDDLEITPIKEKPKPQRSFY